MTNTRTPITNPEDVPVLTWGVPALDTDGNQVTNAVAVHDEEGNVIDVVDELVFETRTAPQYDLTAGKLFEVRNSEDEIVGYDFEQNTVEAPEPTKAELMAQLQALMAQINSLPS